jgi:hypothetical protein
MSASDSVSTMSSRVWNTAKQRAECEEMIALAKYALDTEVRGGVSTGARIRQMEGNMAKLLDDSSSASAPMHIRFESFDDILYDSDESSFADLMVDAAVAKYNQVWAPKSDEAIQRMRAATTNVANTSIDQPIPSAIRISAKTNGPVIDGSLKDKVSEQKRSNTRANKRKRASFHFIYLMSFSLTPTTIV